MRYCPKCGYEYRPEIETCPDCGAGLVEQAEIPVTPLSTRAVVELAVIACLGPWLWYLLAAVASRLSFVPGVFEISGIVVIPILLAAGAVIYGYRRRINASAGALVGGWLASCFIHGAVAAAFVLAGLIPEPWKLVLVLPCEAIVSGIVIILVWFGRMLRYVSVMERLERSNREYRESDE